MPKITPLHLKKIIEVQEITLEQSRRGVSQAWTYRNLIRDRFYISKSTYNKYLARNAKKELTELQQKNNKQIR